jgi:hypothetical protein
VINMLITHQKVLLAPDSSELFKTNSIFYFYVSKKMLKINIQAHIYTYLVCMTNLHRHVSLGGLDKKTNVGSQIELFFFDREWFYVFSMPHSLCLLSS